MVDNNPQQNPEAVPTPKIKLKIVRFKDNDFVELRIKPDTQFKKLFDAVSKRWGITGSMTFRFDGDQIRETDTALSLGLENDF